MRWLGNVSVDKEYRSMVVHLDRKEEVDRLLTKMTVRMTNGECAYAPPFVEGLQPARCYRCHLYGHLHYRCRRLFPDSHFFRKVTVPKSTCSAASVAAFLPGQ